MKLRNFLVLTYLFSLVFISNSFARKPAVEDFVGVETENYKPTSQGTQVLFNFGNHINSHEKKIRSKQNTTNWFAAAILVAFVLLPFFMWVGITNSLNKEDQSAEAVADQNHEQSTEELGNVAHLSDYKTNSDDNDIKKAS